MKSNLNCTLISCPMGRRAVVVVCLSPSSIEANISYPRAILVLFLALSCSVLGLHEFGKDETGAIFAPFQQQIIVSDQASAFGMGAFCCCGCWCVFYSRSAQIAVAW